VYLVQSKIGIKSSASKQKNPSSRPIALVALSYHIQPRQYSQWEVSDSHSREAKNLGLLQYNVVLLVTPKTAWRWRWWDQDSSKRRKTLAQRNSIILYDIFM